MKDKLFYIWSIEHNGWWANGGRGYVKHKAKAGLFTYDRALDIVREGNFATTDVPNEAMIEFITETDEALKKILEETGVCKVN